MSSLIYTNSVLEFRIFSSLLKAITSLELLMIAKAILAFSALYLIYTNSVLEFRIFSSL